jgi:DNA recombination protein RmuC
MPPLDWLLPALAAINLLLLIVLLLRRGADARLDRLERELRDELARAGSAGRQELGQGLSALQQTLLAQSGEALRTQNEQVDAMRVQLGQLQQALSLGMNQASAVLAEQLGALSLANERRLAALQEGNEKKLDQMRATVDEKLHATLEQRLGESFKQVADRLEQVHKGLGEMQTLARDVGSLNRVLTNVKTRGIFGEVQLGNLLEQVLAPEQYAKNVETVPGSNERVEFAIRLPGSGPGAGRPLWLPIDAKFPRDDYERLLDAQERADKPAIEAAARAVEMRLRAEARTIREKYIAAPHTAEFAILFVPTEGLYAEALRRPGLMESLQREHRVTLCGPTTLLATLTSLSMGFRTLALEQRSAEVWEVLGAVKTEFAKFGDVLARTKKKLDEASGQIELAERRTRAMSRSLRGVEALPDAPARRLLELAATDDADTEAPP